MDAIYDVTHTPTKAQYTHYSLTWFLHRYILPLEITIVSGCILVLIGTFMFRPSSSPAPCLILQPCCQYWPVI